MEPRISEGVVVIINLRGTHGSGKTTVARTLIQAAQRAQEMYGRLLGLRMPEANVVRLPGGDADLFILGPYDSKNGCDGCDRIQPFALIPALIEKYAARGQVLFEGALVSTTYGQIGVLLERWKRDAILVFLDTSIEQCLRRVEARRGRDRDERLVNNVAAKFRSIERVRQRVIADGLMRAITTSAEAAPATICDLLRATQTPAIEQQRSRRMTY
jgi:shikimate kinase